MSVQRNAKATIWADLPPQNNSHDIPWPFVSRVPSSLIEKLLVLVQITEDSFNDPLDSRSQLGNILLLFRLQHPTHLDSISNGHVCGIWPQRFDQIFLRIE